MAQANLPNDVWSANNKKARFLLDCLLQAPPGPVVEIGCVRCPTEVASDGYSTVYLARACEASGRSFRSFDLDAAAVTNANSILRAHGLRTVVEHADGISALRALPPSALLYLDSAAEHIHTTRQFNAAELLHRAIVVIDDCQEFAGQQHGKATGILPLCNRFDYDLVPTEPGYLGAIIRFPFGKPRSE